MSGRVLHLPHTLERAFGKRAEARHAKKAGRHSCFPHLRTPCNFHARDGKRCIKPNGSASHIILFPAKAVQLAETAGKRSDIDSWDLIQSAPDPRRHPASSRETIGVRLLLRILFCTAGYPGSYPSVRLSNSSRSAFDSRAISASRCLTTSPMERFPQACHPRSQEDVGTFPSSSVP